MKEERENIRKELEEISPFLSQWKQSERPEGFDVPPAYFQELPDRLIKILKAEEQLSTDRPSFWNTITQTLSHLLQPRYVAGLATVALLVIAGLLASDRTGDASVPDDMFNSLTAEEVSTYIYSNLDEFEERMVLEAAKEYRELSLLPPTMLDDEDLEELIREIDEASIEELL